MMCYGYYIGTPGFILHIYLKCINCDTSKMFKVISNILSNDYLSKAQSSHSPLCLKDNDQMHFTPRDLILVMGNTPVPSAAPFLPELASL